MLGLATPRRRFLQRAVLLVGGLGLAMLWGCGGQGGSGLERPARLVVALKPDKDPDQLLAERKRLSAYLEERLGRPVEVIVPLSGAVIQEGLITGSIDLAYLSATDAARANAAGAGEVLLVGEIEGKRYYESYWLTLKTSPLQTVADLRGRPVALASRSSTSGMLIPLHDLHGRGWLSVEAGPEGFFGNGNVFYGVGYTSAVQRVLDGQADAAAVSDYVFEKDKHLSAADRARLRVLARKGPVPTHVLYLRGSLGADLREQIRRALLEMNERAPALRDQVFTSKLVESNAAEHLQPIEEALDFLARMLR